MKVFIAGLATETNTFSPMPTGLAAFEDGILAHGNATVMEANLFSAPLHVWRREAGSRGWPVVESLCAAAQPAGRTVRKVYEGFREEILNDLEQAMPVDMVLLSLHGAMIADGYDDCEGDLIAHVRAATGPDAFIGAQLDLHCHVTETMLSHATALVSYKEYPHVDAAERAQDLFDLITDAAAGKTRPEMAVWDCRMISTYPTTREPMRSFVDNLKSLEGKDKVLSISLAHGFPWGDCAEVGGKMLVIRDGDKEGATRQAEELGRAFFALRHETATDFLDMDRALGRALAVDGGPVVLADVADNPGGGAPGDSTYLLSALLARGIDSAAIACIWDPIAVQIATDAGEGATLDLRIGGKMGPASGPPVDLTVTVARAVPDARQTGLGETVAPLGDSVAVSAKGIDIVLNSNRTQTFNPDAFTNLGIDPASKKIVVVKSSQHFHAGFAPLAKDVIYVSSPGTIAPEFAKIPFTKLRRPYWPKVEDPFSA